ncbi:MAG: hypothetical protein IJL14_10175, partial [Selenomonadaceae bacterium]|nr:hypothetical protein [Selenomonadaceae bacterium]
MQSIAGKNRGLIERVVQWLKDTMNKFVDHFRNPQGKLKTVQAQALADEFGKIANQLVDANGNKIFRYNRRTKNIELADGRSLDSVRSDGEAKYSSENEKNAVIVTGDEFGEYSDIKELRKKAIQYYKENLQGTSVFNEKLGKIDIDENGLVEFTAAGRKKVESTIAQEQKLLLVKHLPQLIREAKEIQKANATKERHKDDIFYYMKNSAVIDGTPVPVHITLIKHNTRRIQFYNHAVETENAPVNSAEPVSSKEALGLPPVGAPSKKNIPQSENNIKYSIGNDNSSESLKQKIKNKISSMFDGKVSSIRREKKITENLRALSGHRILYGNVKGADDVVVNHMQKLIQSRHAYDWEKLLPVVGEEIAKQLKINPTSAQSNYIADWLLTGALNNTSAEAKEFQKAMRDNPAQAELLQATRDLFQEITDMPPLERIQSKIVERQNKSLWERLGVFKGGFSEEFLDDLSPLQDLVERAIKNSPPEVAAELKRGVDVKKLAQLSRGRGA